METIMVVILVCLRVVKAPLSVRGQKVQSNGRLWGNVWSLSKPVLHSSTTYTSTMVYMDSMFKIWSDR